MGGKVGKVAFCEMKSARGAQHDGGQGTYGEFVGGNLLGKFLEKCRIRVTANLGMRRIDVSALVGLANARPILPEN